MELAMKLRPRTPLMPGENMKIVIPAIHSAGSRRSPRSRRRQIATTIKPLAIRCERTRNPNGSPTSSTGRITDRAAGVVRQTQNR